MTALLLLLTTLCGQAQVRKISVHIQDAKTNEALPYVNVYVSGKQGTITNLDGDFEIDADEEDLLCISCIGYEDIRIKASALPNRLKMVPLDYMLQELTVKPVETILKKTVTKLNKEYKRKWNKSDPYFYRLSTTYSDKRELVEAITKGRSAVNMREMSFVSGRRGLMEAGRLHNSRLSNANLHHVLELGPMIMGSPFWSRFVRPFPEKWNARVFNAMYDYSLTRTKTAEEQEILCIELTPKLENMNIISGKLYIDADKHELLRFDGQVKGLAMDLEKDMRKESGQADVDFHISYDHSQGYTRVVDMASTIKAGDLTCQTILYNIGNHHLKRKRGTKVEENMLRTIDMAGYDSTLWAMDGVVKRTEEERQLAKVIQEEEARKKEREKYYGQFLNLVKRLERFGSTIPQEKVYVHMDNYSYFMGDTIWFSAYTRQTTDCKPSLVSGVLYVELLNEEGYLVERKMIEMNKGRGNGFFALNHYIQYAGFYELRAYTRWQLNWGQFTRKHNSHAMADWFVNDTAETLYFRDYEKLYSRVFPVYDKPKEEGNYEHLMTRRVLRRRFKKDPDKHQPTLTLFPEGGNLIAGIPNRVAFEAIGAKGEWMEGWLHVGNDSVKAVNRGRGAFTLTPKPGKEMELTFVSTTGEKASCSLQKADETGVAIHVNQKGEEWELQARVAGKLSSDSLAMTIMHEGRLEQFIRLSGKVTDYTYRSPDNTPGIRQATVFDEHGRVYADRLFFVTGKVMNQPTIQISGIRESYQPTEQITLKLTTTQQTGDNEYVSLSVKDAGTQESLYDNGSILTEMLLASEIRGFVPNPGWFFERDDQERRDALDLMMMTQGWRRFNWKHMAVRGEWELTQKDEHAPYIQGYLTSGRDNRVNTTNDSTLNGIQGGRWKLNVAQGKRIRLHSVLSDIEDGEHPQVHEMDTENGRFTLQLPRFTGRRILFLSAASAKEVEKKPNYTWIQMMEDQQGSPRRKPRLWRTPQPDYEIRVIQPYPRFVKPYSFYQCHIQPQPSILESTGQHSTDSIHLINELDVQAQRRFQRRFSDKWPAISIDAYEAYNNCMDAGLTINYGNMARYFIGDMGSDFPYVTYGQKNDGMIRIRFGLSPERRALPQYLSIPADSIYHPKYLVSLNEFPSTAEHQRYFTAMFNLDRVILYTDYCPRMIGSKRYKGENLPETILAVHPYPDGTSRVFYRDRRYVIEGFDEPATFYSPDYSRHQLPEGQKDYRRTLYWNPALELDKNGEAQVTLYNNSQPTRISVEAEGQSANGMLLWGKE